MTTQAERDAYRELQRQVFRRDSWRCRVCRGSEGLHAHHIVFRSHGGPDTTQNLISVCHACHAALHRRGKFTLHIRQWVKGFDGPVDANEWCEFVKTFKDKAGVYVLQERPCHI